MDSTSTISKMTLRDEIRNRRSSLSSRIRSDFDKAIQQHLSVLIRTQKTLSIACYWPFNGEPDITPLCRQLMTGACTFALPVVSGNNDHVMRFHAWQAETRLIKNRYGIYEPRESATIPVSSFDMLLIPLVGYDRVGNRLGMGSGYYDRHLESLRDQPVPLRVGIAYSLQEIEPIKKNNWDIPLHGVVNERGWFTFVNS